MDRTAVRPGPMAIGNGALNSQSWQADSSEHKRGTAFAQAMRRARRSKPKLQTIVNAQVRRFLVDRYGACLPDDDAGRSDLFVAVQVLASTGTGEPNVRIYIRAVAPWLGEAETDTMVDRVYRKLLRYRPDTLGRALHVTDAQRTRLKIWNIGAVDVPKEVREARRSAKKVAQRKAARRASGVQSRSEYLARCHTASEPWQVFGVSRRTWERRGKPMPSQHAAGPTPSNLSHRFGVRLATTSEKALTRAIDGVRIDGLADQPGRAPTALKRLAPLAAALSHQIGEQKDSSGKNDGRRTAVPEHDRREDRATSSLPAATPPRDIGQGWNSHRQARSALGLHWSVSDVGRDIGVPGGTSWERRIYPSRSLMPDNTPQVGVSNTPRQPGGQNTNRNYRSNSPSISSTALQARRAAELRESRALDRDGMRPEGRGQANPNGGPGQ